MRVLVSVLGGTSMTVGALAALRYLLTLTASRTWSRLRAVARVSPATTPDARRDALSWLRFSVASAISGTLLLLNVLNVLNEAARLSASAALTALVMWQLRSVFMSRRQRHSAG